MSQPSISLSLGEAVPRRGRPGEEVEIFGSKVPLSFADAKQLVRFQNRALSAIVVAATYSLASMSKPSQPAMRR